jgi:predicted transcriptional regulator
MSIDKKYKEETERRRYLNTLGDPLPEIDEEKDIDVIAETKLKDL